MSIQYDFHLNFDDLKKSTERLEMLLNKYRSAKTMPPEVAIQVITDEELYIAPYNWFEERRATEDEIGLLKQDTHWQVYTASERANPSDIKEYDAIEVALDDFIQRLRDSKQIILERAATIDKMNKIDGEQYYLIAMNKRKTRHSHLNEEWLSNKDRIYQMMS